MKTGLYLLISFLGVLMMVWSTYWFMIRPYLVDRCVRKISRIRGEFLRATLDKQPGFDDELGKQLLRGTAPPEAIGLVTFSMVAMTAIRDFSSDKRAAAKEDMQFQIRKNNAHTWVRDLYEQKSDAVAAIIVFNSPTWWIVIFFCILGTLISGKAKNYKERLGGNVCPLIPAAC